MKHDTYDEALYKYMIYFSLPSACCLSDQKCPKSALVPSDFGTPLYGYYLTINLVTYLTYPYVVLCLIVSAHALIAEKFCLMSSV